MAEETGRKPSNPKDAIGCKKLPLDLVPDTALAHQAMAHLDGALKYGAYNWRTAGVRSSIYVAACRRHLADWWNGEDYAPDSEVHHLGHAIACLNIILDSYECQSLTDDRPPMAPVRETIDRLNRLVAAKVEEAESKKIPSPPVPAGIPSVRKHAWVLGINDEADGWFCVFCNTRMRDADGTPCPGPSE